MKIIRALLNSRSQIDYSNVEGLVEINEETRIKLQNTLLEMYKDVLSVCTKYDIIPFLAGGSSLGALRNGGFIPWDDDLDFCMTRDDYNKFFKIFEKELSEKYVISAPNYSKKPKARFAKIMKKGTLCRESGDRSPTEECGIFIDLFIIDNIPDSVIWRSIKGFICNVMEFVSGQVYYSEDLSINVNDLDTEKRIRWYIGVMFSFMSSYQWFNLIDRFARHNNNKSKHCAVVTGRKHYFGEILDRDDIKPARYIKFCDIEAPVFNNFPKYLETLYGSDYMTPPPESKRERHMVKKLVL